MSTFLSIVCWHASIMYQFYFPLHVAYMLKIPKKLQILLLLHMHTHAPIVHVYIAGCLEWKSRLVNGSTPNEGRLEICYNNNWRTICESHWTDAYAEVVCRNLGHSTIGILL